VRPAVRSRDLAQAARSPRCAATRATRATTEPEPDPAGTEPEPDPAATEPYADDPAAAAAAPTEAAAPAAATNKSTTAATSEAAAATATSAAAATTATTASASYLHAATEAFPVEEMERGEAHVGHFLFAENEAVIGRGVVRLRDTRSGHRGCGSAAHQRKTQSSGT